MLLTLQYLKTLTNIIAFFFCATFMANTVLNVFLETKLTAHVYLRCATLNIILFKVQFKRVN